MFAENMIAPCGLDCSICALAVHSDKPCAGCLGPDENKPDYCATVCQIIRCAKRLENSYRFCSECPDYPCQPIEDLEERYMNQYPLQESVKGNLQKISEKGMEAYLRGEAERWICADCGGVICVHTGRCGSCGRQYGDADKAIKWS